MPELPEVQTIVSGLKNKILNKKIVSITEMREGTIRFHTKKKQREFGKLTSILRKGKYIILKVSKDIKFVIHLRMTGKLIFDNSAHKLPSHTRAYFDFEDDSRLIFDDVRAFGKIEVYRKKASVSAIEKLGLDPIGDRTEFTPEYLRCKLKNRKAPIKNLLLNQKLIAGIGNIYACEILFRANILPTVSGRQLTSEQIRKLHLQIIAVLDEAIAKNGTSISDFRNIDNKTGKFQNFLKVYQKKTCDCGAKITKIQQAGRSTYYCEECQEDSRSNSQKVRTQRFSRSSAHPEDLKCGSAKMRSKEKNGFKSFI